MRKSEHREKIFLEQREQLLASLGSESFVDEFLPPRRKYLTWRGNLFNLQTFECPILILLNPFLSHTLHHFSLETYSVHREKKYREKRQSMLGTLGSEALVDKYLRPPRRLAKIPGDPGYVDFRIGRYRYQTRYEYDNQVSVPKFWDAESCVAHPYEYPDDH